MDELVQVYFCSYFDSFIYVIYFDIMVLFIKNKCSIMKRIE